MDAFEPEIVEFLLGIPLRLLAYLAVLVVEAEPPSFNVLLRVPGHLVQLHLMLVVVAVQEIVELTPATANLEHAFLVAARLEGFTSLPALAACDLVSFELEPVLLETTGDVEAPVVPHGRPRSHDVVRLRIQFRHLLNRVEVFAAAHFRLLRAPRFVLHVFLLLLSVASFLVTKRSGMLSHVLAL